MLKRLSVVLILIFSYFLFTYQYLNSLLINVEKAESEVVISLDKQQYLLESMTNILYEISKYNTEQIETPLKYLSDSEEVEVIKESIRLSRSNIIELNNRLDILIVQVEGCSNRISVARKRLIDSLTKYEKSRQSLWASPAVNLFKFKKITLSSVHLQPLKLALYSRKE